MPIPLKILAVKSQLGWRSNENTVVFTCILLPALNFSWNYEKDAYWHFFMLIETI